MASTDSRPVPIKNTAYRAVFPIFDNTGSLVSGAAGLDSEVSKDQGTFADCTNEATEIATSSGMYYLDLTSTEMNADCVAVIVKTSTSNAKTTPLVIYPQEAGDIKVDLQAINGTALSALTGPFPAFGIADSGTAQAATGTTLQLRSAAAFADDELNGATIFITGGSAGVGQSRLITDYVGSTDTATVDTWTTTPTGAITYIIFATPPNSGTSAPTAAQIRTEMDSNSTQLAKLGSPAGASISADIATTNGRLTSTRAGYLDNLSAGAVAQAAALSTAQTAITAIKAKTDNLPTSPAASTDTLNANLVSVKGNALGASKPFDTA